MKVEYKLTGIDGVLEMLQKLPAEFAAKGGGPARTALRRGASVIHKPALANLQSVTSNTTDDAKRASTGLLAKNLVITRGKAPIDGKGERVLIRVRRKIYPGRSGQSGGQKATTTLASGQMLEYGTSQQRAEPWLRPAFEAHARSAISTIEKEVVAAIERISRKLAKRAGGK